MFFGSQVCSRLSYWPQFYQNLAVALSVPLNHRYHIPLCFVLSPAGSARKCMRPGAAADVRALLDAYPAVCFSGTRLTHFEPAAPNICAPSNAAVGRYTPASHAARLAGPGVQGTEYLSTHPFTTATTQAFHMQRPECNKPRLIMSVCTMPDGNQRQSLLGPSARRGLRAAATDTACRKQTL